MQIIGPTCTIVAGSWLAFYRWPTPRKSWASLSCKSVQTSLVTQLEEIQALDGIWRHLFATRHQARFDNLTLFVILSTEALNWIKTFMPHLIFLAIKHFKRDLCIQVYILKALQLTVGPVSNLPKTILSQIVIILGCF